MGGLVEVKREPSMKSVSDYDQYLKYNAPNKNAELFTRNREIRCTCCTQKAPSEAAALLKFEDQTPFTDRFNTHQSWNSDKLGETMWICADCYTNGVRPKYKWFGQIKWNEMGRKVKKRADELDRSPW